MLRSIGFLVLVLSASPASAQGDRLAPSEVAGRLFQRLVQGDLAGAARLFDVRAREYYGVRPSDALTVGVLGASLHDRASWDAARFEYLNLSVEGDAAAVTFLATRPDPLVIGDLLEADAMVRSGWTQSVSLFLAREFPDAWQSSGAARSSQTAEQLVLVENEIGRNPLESPAFWDALYRSVHPPLRALVRSQRLPMQTDTVTVGLSRSPGGPWGVVALSWAGPFSGELEEYLDSVGSGPSAHRRQQLRDAAHNDAVRLASDLQAWGLKPLAFQGGNGSLNGATLTRLGYTHSESAGMEEQPVTDWVVGYSSCLSLRPSGRAWLVRAFTDHTVNGCDLASLAVTLTVTGLGVDDIRVEEVVAPR